MYYKNEYKNRFSILKYSVISVVVACNLYAAPSGGTVVSGDATINQSGNTTNINQSSNKATINWQDFSIKSNEIVNFNQPNSNSITLNRVIGNEKSIIDGALNANGQVWLINSNGVLFGKNAKVNTAGIVASTKDISNEDFNKGNYNFKGNSTASIVNEGEIKSLANTHTTFIANSVTNKGKIEVHKGTINLVGASDVTLTLNENQNLSLKVNKGVLDALVDNQNLIVANGGQIYLTTNAKDELLKGVVNHSGIIEVNSLDELTQSEVILFAHGGTANIDGTINAKGGFVETSGEKLNVTSNTKVVAKDWLLDPTNILIESTGGNILTGESVSATAIENNLETTNVHLQATNNITVNQNITWGTDKQLKLEADNINVNATINNTNQTNGGVYFQAANTTNKVVFHTNGKVVVNNVYQLQWINQALNGNYELGSNIDAGVTKTDTAKWGTTGFNPIGDNTNKFAGTFDGLGFTISNLYINRPNQDYVGLFGYTNSSAVIKNIGLKDAGITGKDFVGALVGRNDNGKISNSYASGTVSGINILGGLVGLNENGTISNSYGSGSVNGDYYVGGLVGVNDGGTISNSYATGTVKGPYEYVGGLAGTNSGTIENSFYDNETNTKSMFDSSYGKTKAEILSSFSGKTGWGTTGGGASASGYEILLLPYLISVTKDEDKSKYILFSGGFGTSANPYKITNWTQLQNINNSNILTQNYYFNLLNNLSSSTSDYTNLASNSANGGLGWNPIGNDTNKFVGTFDGLGFTISDLYINRPTQDLVGLFGYTNNANIKNIGLKDVDITGGNSTGALVGYNDYGIISNSYASGNVNGKIYIGGLVGENENGTIENSYASGSVNGDYYVGGLVGVNENGTISNSYASGNVSGIDFVGGLVGYNYSGTIENSFYDNETNTASMKDSSYCGKTKAEILAQFKGEDGWITSGADVAGYSIDTILLPQLKTFYKPTNTLFQSGYGTTLNPYTITNWTQLQNINNSNILTQNYYFNLLNNLSSSTSDYTNLASNSANSNLGWNPIGNITNKFVGTFDGLGFTISNLYINRPTQNYVGLFGVSNNSAIIKNIGLENLSIAGKNYVGGLVGLNNGTISNSYASGNVSGSDFVGGLVGVNDGGTISNSYASGSVNGDYYVGGLVGVNDGGTISNSYANGNVSGSDFVGGLVGLNYSGTISNSYASGTVNGKDNVGGLVGHNSYGTISNSYTTGNLNGQSFLGGLVGKNDYGTISNSYSSGSVKGDLSIGGLVGYNKGTISNSYSSGSVKGHLDIGGLVGYNDYGTISNSFYDKTKYTGNGVGNNSTHSGVTGKTTQEMSYGETFKNASWDIVADSSVTSLTPVIKWDSINNKYVWAIAPLALTYTLGDKTTTYNGTTQNLSTFYNNSTNIFGTNHSFIDLSKYKFQVAGSDVTGYKDADIYNSIKLVNNSDSFAILKASGNTDGKLTINKKDLTISNITANNKTYDGTTTATLSNIGSLVGLVTGEDLVLNNPTSVIFSSKDVGDNIDVTATGYTISNKDSFKASNYNLLDTSKTTTANISKASLTATLNDNSKTYDGVSYSGGSGITYNGFVNGETASSLAGTLLYSGTSQGAKDAGNYIISGSGLTSNNYNISFVNGKLTINKKDLTISNITANNKTYDGTTTATLSNIGSLVGLVTGEDLVLNNPTSVIFSNKDVGDDIVVTATGYTISNKDSFKASNYNLLDTSKTTTANIVASVNPTPTPTDNNQKPKVDEKVQRVIASIEPSTNSSSSSNQSVPSSLNSDIRTLSFNGVDETRVINGGVRVPDNIVNNLDEL